ncbi:hypothetical protein [Mycolicibacterium fortuitum]|uniref:hypothetical protein n=1 Tax=Mycolicibacterium fortuitum TaxID=1766 RepID=UPI003AAC92E2
MTAPVHFPTATERAAVVTAAAEPADFEAIAQGAGIPKAGRIRHWFEQGWCAAARSDVLMHGGTDHALVRYALRFSHAEAGDRPARRAFAKGVRAKLADYRSRGII